MVCCGPHHHVDRSARGLGPHPHQNTQRKTAVVKPKAFFIWVSSMHASKSIRIYYELSMRSTGNSYLGPAPNYRLLWKSIKVWHNTHAPGTTSPQNLMGFFWQLLEAEIIQQTQPAQPLPSPYTEHAGAGRCGGMHPRGSPDAPLESRRKVGPPGPIKTVYQKKTRARPPPQLTRSWTVSCACPCTRSGVRSLP